MMDWYIKAEFDDAPEGFYKYPWNYGTSCKAWDESLQGFGCADEDGNALDDADESCAWQWCYVDASCDLFDVTDSSLGDL